MDMKIFSEFLRWIFLPTWIQNFRVLNSELPDLLMYLGKLQRIWEKSQSIRATPEYPGWNPENLDYSQNLAKYLKSVDRVWFLDERAMTREIFWYFGSFVLDIHLN